MKKFLVFLFMAILFGMISQASALSLSIGDSYYVGYINDGIPSNPTDEVAYINTLILQSIPLTDTSVTIGTEAYNRYGSTLTEFEDAVIAGAFKDESETNTVTLTGDFTYIVGKYDATKAGSLVWYNPEGFSGEIVLPTTFNRQGISHISAYSSTETVPEPSTMFLLGACLVGLAGIRHKIKK